jgi:hypothetical protein
MSSPLCVAYFSSCMPEALRYYPIAECSFDCCDRKALKFKGRPLIKMCEVYGMYNVCAYLGSETLGLEKTARTKLEMTQVRYLHEFYFASYFLIVQVKPLVITIEQGSSPQEHAICPYSNN